MATGVNNNNEKSNNGQIKPVSFPLRANEQTNDYISNKQRGQSLIDNTTCVVRLVIVHRGKQGLVTIIIRVEVGSAEKKRGGGDNNDMRERKREKSSRRPIPLRILVLNHSICFSICGCSWCEVGHFSPILYFGC